MERKKKGQRLTTGRKNKKKILRIRDSSIETQQNGGKKRNPTIKAALGQTGSLKSRERPTLYGVLRRNETAQGIRIPITQVKSKGKKKLTRPRTAKRPIRETKTANFSIPFR